ncbi:conserved hypothetical protein [Talaromyces stipitatus ATCC 10500]|uniref:Ty3 transposon capsid-like protein domain-containing protein n=1 Tax=Talaromyces stipitatus (strain ATCC 10500 / CBS 375.48 / QM 6759 / NRRL 1006) TaxID=441959 RepID=B8MEZ4_TALSN|nr:uncharacterized protein TSTA_008880 [Talaromyces stipitatus ATCC 10500]EED15763.1 conserved hypothetical protein [Talaromyces stipitatus ATCC 10500]
MASAAPSTQRPAIQSQPTQSNEQNEKIDMIGTHVEKLTRYVEELKDKLTEKDDQVEQLEAQVLALGNENDGKPTAGSNKVKMPKPMNFDGTQSKLKSFLVNMDMHLDANKITSDKEKVIFVASCLTDEAADWMQLMLDDYYNDDADEWDELTKTIFRSYKNFQIKLEESFDNINEIHTAKRKLRFLQQTGSAQQLAIKFKQIISPLHYDDDVLIGLFENMLKEELQTKLIKMDRPDKLGKFIEMAVKMDNKLQKKAHGTGHPQGQKNQIATMIIVPTEQKEKQQNSNEIDHEETDKYEKT